MWKVLKKIWLIGALTLIAASHTAGNALAQENSCSTLMRHNLEKELTASAPGLTQASLCSDSTSEDTENILSGLNPAERKASKQLLCGKPKPLKKIKAQHRVLKNLVGKSLLREYEQCIDLQQQGADVIFNTPAPESGIVNVALELNKPGLEFRDITVEPEGALNCSGFGSTPGVNNQSLWGVCERNLDVPAPVSIIKVRLSRGLLNIRVADPTVETEQARTGNVRWELPALPNIPSCRVVSAADRILSCSEPLGQNLCYRELRAGNVLDCRSEIAPTIFPNVREVQNRYDINQIDFSRRGALGVTVYRNRPDDGVIAGEIQYTMNFATPVLAERGSNVCDRSCPLFGSERACNRDCVFAEHVLESESAFGVVSLTREQGDSCEAPLTGSIQLSDIDKYRAYNICESQNAWGRSTTGVLHTQVSKFYYMNDYRTSHVQVRSQLNGRHFTYERWNLDNAGERVRNITPLELNFTIACNR